MLNFSLFSITGTVFCNTSGNILPSCGAKISYYLICFFSFIGFTQFLARDVLDTFPQLLDNGLRMLLQLLTSWKNALNPGARQSKDDPTRNTNTRPVRSEHQPQQQQQQVSTSLNQL